MHPRQCRLHIIVCYHEQGIDFYLLAFTGLYHFTLSHYGSSSPLPTLKPYVTISAPRLSTGCWLGFTRWDSHPLYINHRTGAHSFMPPPVKLILYFLLFFGVNKHYTI